MQKHRQITIERLDKFTSTNQWSDVNLSFLLWKNHIQIDSFEFYGPCFNRPCFADAIKATFEATTRSDLIMSPSWSTYWIHLYLQIPLSFKGDRVFLLFDPNCEALFYNVDGLPLQGITGGSGGDRHVDVLLSDHAVGGEKFEFYIEIACNGMFGNPGSEAGIITAPIPNRQFSISTFSISAANKSAQKLLTDFELIRGMAKDMPSNSQISSDALYTANAIVNAVHADDPSTIEAGLTISNNFFSSRVNYCHADHLLTATGHCHIDTAWLWPYAETVRKCARSFATQINLMDRYPDYKFSCSQAQQYEWIEEQYPLLFARIQEKVKNNQFIPVGGTWIEMDCNVPSGESFCRQFLYGQKYFESRFGKRHDVFWLPDTFGYSSQLPQIVKESDLKYFYTQKLSWNNINKFPHTTFNWVGSDGTSVLTHFSPTDTYCAQGTVRDVVFSVTNNKDKEYSNQSLLLFGNGDGGGGPLSTMIDRLERLKSVSGLPSKVEFGEPSKFYENLEKSSRDLVKWKGELYFELHRGTYTTQAKIKQYNRKCEYLLQRVEFLYSRLFIQGKCKNPKTELDRLWKLVLLNQFHDVLPGSSIEMVYDDAKVFYKDVEASCNSLINQAIELMSTAEKGTFLYNTTCWNLSSRVVELEKNDLGCIAGEVVIGANGKGIIVAPETLPYSASAIKSSRNSMFEPVVLSTLSSGQISIENQFIIVVINTHGQLTRLFDKKAQREVIALGSTANVFKIYEDVPLYWDAWDVEIYHLEKGWNAQLGLIKIKEQNSLRVIIECNSKITSTSSISQQIIITATSPLIEFETNVSWNENRKILKVEFPVDISCDYATYESQFGYVQRPTHSNTSWDMSKFEVCGHKFVDFSEFGYGVSLLNDCKYGMAVHGNLIRLSLLRAPKAPDEHCDLGDHTFRYALYPHSGTFHESNVVQTAYQFNVAPLILNRGLFDATSLFSISGNNHVVLDTIKVSEDGTGVVLRLYEAYGGRGIVKVTCQGKIKDVYLVNILEDVKERIQDESDHFNLMMLPFKIVSVLVCFN